MAEGYTYFDTAWAYAGSEDAIRQALVERYPRESYQLATKAASCIQHKEISCKRYDHQKAAVPVGQRGPVFSYLLQQRKICFREGSDRSKDREDDQAP